MGSSETHMITWESFTFKQDFVAASWVWLVKCSHEEMQICGQRLHDSNLSWLCSHNGRHHLRRLIIDVEPGWQWGI
jgi:hypothetical protein